MQKAGVIILISGLILMIGSGIFGVVAGSKGFSEIKAATEHHVEKGSATLALQEDVGYVIYSPTKSPQGSCEVLTPDGKQAEKSDFDQNFTLEEDGREFFPRDAFWTAGAGDYSVKCDGEILVSPDSVYESAGVLLIGSAVSVLGFMAGFFAMIVGAVLAIVGSARKKKQQMNQGQLIPAGQPNMSQPYMPYQGYQQQSQQMPGYPQQPAPQYGFDPATQQQPYQPPQPYPGQAPGTQQPGTPQPGTPQPGSPYRSY